MNGLVCRAALQTAHRYKARGEVNLPHNTLGSIGKLAIRIAPAHQVFTTPQTPMPPSLTTGWAVPNGHLHPWPAAVEQQQFKTASILPPGRGSAKLAIAALSKPETVAHDDLIVTYAYSTVWSMVDGRSSCIPEALNLYYRM